MPITKSKSHARGHKESQTPRSPARRLVSILLAALLGGTLSLAGASSANAVAGGACEYAVVIGVRGTDAPAGTGTTHSGRLYAAGGFGPEIDPLITRFKNDVFPYYYRGLNYPAAGGAAYVNSAVTGRTNLVNEINYLAGLCGAVSPQVVLIGHSQGAAVVRSALVDLGQGPTLTTKAKKMIRAVVLYGDPNYMVNQPSNAPGAQNSSSGLLGAATHMDQVNGYRYWGWPMGGNGPGWVQVVRSYCYAKDYFCASGTASNSMSIHNSYGENATTTVYHWIDYMLTSQV